MNESVLKLKWLDTDAAGYIDVFPLSVFDKEGSLAELTHQVEGPRGGIYEAKCAVKVQKAIAEFDYKVFPNFNRKHRMELGVLRLKFTDGDRAQIIQVQWKGAKRKSFTKAKFEIEMRPPPKPGPYSPKGKPSEKKERLIRERPGQKSFRSLLKRIYQGRCCITGCPVSETLEGVHIDPFTGTHSDHPLNGLLLRGDLHTLFDAGLLAIHPESRRVYFAVLAQQWPEYLSLHRTAILRKPDKAFAAYGPSVSALKRRWHIFTTHHCSK